MTTTLAPVSTLINRASRAQRTSRGPSSAHDADLSTPLLHSNGHSNVRIDQGDSCERLSVREKKLLGSLYEPEDLETLLHSSGDQLLPANIDCIVDSTRQLGEQFPATVAQLHRTPIHVGLAQQIQDGRKAIYKGHLGRLQHASVVVQSLPPSTPGLPRKTCLTIIPSLPSRVSELLSAVAVLQREIQKLGHPIAECNQIAIKSSGPLWRSRQPKDVETIFRAHHWRVSSFVDELGHRYRGAIPPGPLEDDSVVEIPQVTPVSSLRLCMGIADRSKADFQYYANALQRMFGKPS